MADQETRSYKTCFGHTSPSQEVFAPICTASKMILNIQTSHHTVKSVITKMMIDLLHRVLDIRRVWNNINNAG